MEDGLRTVHQELVRLTLAWSIDGEVDEARAASLRREAAALNHRHYHRSIPFYRKLCERARIREEPPTFETILRELMIPDDVFKSYRPSLLESRDFKGMDAWIRNISDRPIDGDDEDAGDIDAWIERLAASGLHLVFSSGTSGRMSFVPRWAESWDAFVSLPYVYMPGLLAQRGVLPFGLMMLLGALAPRLKPETFLDLVQRFALRDFDGYFLNFAGGNQGIQLVGQEAARLVRSACFLYEAKMSATAVKSIIAGPKNELERRQVEAFLETTVHKKDDNYARFLGRLKGSIARRHKVMLFGTPYLLKELAERIASSEGAMVLPKGSQVTFGGGWKSLDGSRISEAELISLVSRTFGLDRAAVLEGYSMTEINALMLKCSAGRYHVPPFLEAVVFDEALEPMTGADATGALGVIDPFAISYPGFLITGDHVRLVRGECECGVSGPAILAVERSPGREVKGCGGIMAAVNA
jgi:acyl-protein synthetase LuxE